MIRIGVRVLLLRARFPVIIIFCTVDRGKLTTAQVETCTVYEKKYPRTGIPWTFCATADQILLIIVPQYGYSVQKSCFWNVFTVTG
jgi:hypothetical protein